MVLFSVKYLFFVFRSVYCSQCFCFLLSIYSLSFVLCTAPNVARVSGLSLRFSNVYLYCLMSLIILLYVQLSLKGATAFIKLHFLHFLSRLKLLTCTTVVKSKVWLLGTIGWGLGLGGDPLDLHSFWRPSGRGGR